MTDKSILVFPAGMPSALAWARRAQMSGSRVVGASSLQNDPARDQYREWASLPWIGDGDFAASLGRCVTALGVRTVFTTHPVVSAKLREVLPLAAPGVQLETERAWDADFADYGLYREIAERFHQQPFELTAAGSAKPPLSTLQLSALVRLFQLTPGQCGYQKLEALAALFRYLPAGDLVEIGSLWGRSAVALAQLARYYGTGKLLCIDPWATEELVQGISQIDSAGEEVRIDEVFHAFRINLAPFAGLVNYLRSRSSDAAAIYSKGACVASEDFGSTTYAGRIALLHIDGNHALDAVRSDIAQWRKWVRPGGWIVFDDYCWSFGDGPKTAADEFCRDFERCLANGFVADGALFLQVVDPLLAESPLNRKNLEVLPEPITAGL